VLCKLRNGSPAEVAKYAETDKVELTEKRNTKPIDISENFLVVTFKIEDTYHDAAIKPPIKTSLILIFDAK